MVTTKIFIASSAENLRSDLLEIGNFFQRLNSCYIKKDLFFDVVFSADLPDVMDTQREITESSAAFFLLNPDVEDSATTTRCVSHSAATHSAATHSAATPSQSIAVDTNEEGFIKVYKTARDSYNETGRPKIAIYVKTNDNLQDNAALSGDKFGGDAELYRNTYNHTDTLKLGILMQIKQFNLPGVDIRLEGGKAWQGNSALLSLNNVGSIAGFENLQSLKEKFAEIESRYYTARTRYSENPDDSEAHGALLDASGQRGSAMREIREIESQLYHMMEGMYEQTAQGKLSKRQTEGYKLIERGLLNEARDVLDYYAIVSESRHDEDMVDQAAARAAVHIKELMQLRDVNVTLHDWEGVDGCLKEASRLEEKFNLRPDSTLNYLEFLKDQNRFDEAFDIGEKLQRNYLSHDAYGKYEGVAFVYESLGIICQYSNRMPEAERMYKAALEVGRNQLCSEKSSNDAIVLVVYANLFSLYTHQGRLAEAIDLSAAAMEVSARLSESEDESIANSLGMFRINLGDVFNETGRYDESIKIMMEAVRIYERMTLERPDKDEYKFLLSICCHNLALSYTRLKRYDEAEKQFEAVLDAQRALAGSNPDAYEWRLADCYTDFGKLCFEAGRFAEAEEHYKTALSMLKRIAVSRPDSYIGEYAKCHCYIGELYAALSRLPEAEAAVNAAVRLYEKHKDSFQDYAEKIAGARKLLSGASDLRQIAGDMRQIADDRFTLLTPEEKSIALLLIEGETKRDISRKLNISAEEVGSSVKAIREKVVSMAGSDTVAEAVARDYKLTRREADMLRYLRLNVSNYQIAEELYLSEETVRTHIRSLLKKLSLETRLEVSDLIKTYAEK